MPSGELRPLPAPLAPTDEHGARHVPSPVGGEHEVAEDRAQTVRGERLRAQPL
ncbi:hypothetical protein [Streptomyces sp. NPDC057686]|uniref:hypothetical protein n=1 Tax=Streptomyces sp. NPDC057686 TaxID=3346212 RepID=UPI0036AB1EB1